MRAPDITVWTIIALGGLAGGCTKGQEQVFLTCDLMGNSKQVRQYSYRFEPETPSLFWVEGSQEMKVIRITDSQLWAEHSARFHQFSYDQTSFQLNRVTGQATIFYSRQPHPEEIAECEKDPGWGCDNFVVLEEHTETGECQVTEPKI